MKEYHKLIFVCIDNTCRSVMAEAVMKRVSRSTGVQILSRGLVVLFPEPFNPKAVAILKGDGLEPSGSNTVLLTEADITDDTLILTMTQREGRRARKKFGHEEDIYALGDYAGKPGDIEEPCGGSLADYGACYEYIDLMVKLAAEKIRKQS